MRKSGQVRWQESKQSYLIADGSRLWRIDEEANIVQAGSNPWRDQETQQIDLLSFLGLKGKNLALLRNARAVDQKTIDGVACNVFRAVVRDSERDLIVEAFADVESNQLRTIACWVNDGSKRVSPPIAELKLISRNAPVDDSKFVVAKTLTQDGRIGKLVDRQGIVTLQPLTGQRWTPVNRSVLVKTGDWVRTGRRGANAAAIQLESGYRITLGPATLVEFMSVNSIQIHGGEVHVAGNNRASGELTLIGPSKQTIKCGRKSSELHRVVADGGLRLVKRKPIWLQGFEGTSTNESLGSLIANVRDGDPTPLSIGYHKVNVEIRDQIARTTIEESFKNHTSSRLEGIFHFPLPQDASISGFGMWINGELVEADVVEKTACPRNLRDDLARKRRSSVARMDGRQHLQSPRVSD